MKTSAQMERVMEELSLREGSRVSREVEAAQSRAVASYLRGDQQGAYRQMVVILRHFKDRNQDLPEPCENLFKCLLASDVITEYVREKRETRQNLLKRGWLN